MTVILYLLAILGANLLVTYHDPVPIGFGYTAPAGVYLVAYALVLRDLVQRRWGVKGAAVALVGGVALSYAFASPGVVSASVAAFAVSFVVDTAVFSLLYRRFALWIGALISGLVAIVPDTLVFLGTAPQLVPGMDNSEFIPGQLLGKLYGTVLAAVVLLGYTQVTQRRACRECGVKH